MLATTLDAVRSIIKTDPTATPTERAAILAAIREHGRCARTATATAARLLKRSEVAARLSCCPRTVDGLARSGTLRRVLFPGRVRGSGFVESDVVALIQGTGGAEGGAA